MAMQWPAQDGHLLRVLFPFSCCIVHPQMLARGHGGVLGLRHSCAARRPAGSCSTQDGLALLLCLRGCPLQMFI